MMKHISKWPTGSRYICNPAPTDTDNDTVILVEDAMKAWAELSEEGWDIGGSLVTTSNWASYKKRVDGITENFIVTQDADLFRKWVTATELAKKLNLLHKPDRIALFGVIVNGDTLY